jgi:hypothetical protein
MHSRTTGRGLAVAVVAALLPASMLFPASAVPSATGAGRPASHLVAATRHTGSARPAWRLITYQGHGVDVWRGGGDTRHLKRAARPFKRFVVHRLDWLWRWVHRRPACAHSEFIWVKRIRTDGFAAITGEGVQAHAGDPGSCSVGAQHAIYGKVQGHWSALLASEELFRCTALRRHKVPSSIAGHTCLSAANEIVPYHHR